MIKDIIWDMKFRIMCLLSYLIFLSFIISCVLVCFGLRYLGCNPVFVTTRPPPLAPLFIFLFHYIYFIMEMVISCDCYHDDLMWWNGDGNDISRYLSHYLSVFLFHYLTRRMSISFIYRIICWISFDDDLYLSFYFIIYLTIYLSISLSIFLCFNQFFFNFLFPNLSPFYGISALDNPSNKIPKTIFTREVECWIKLGMINVPCLTVNESNKMKAITFSRQQNEYKVKIIFDLIIYIVERFL